MVEPLRIEIELDRSPAKPESEKFRADQKKLGEALAADASASEKKQAAAAKNSLGERVAAAQKAAEERKRLERELVTDTGIQERAKAELYRRTNRDRVTEARRTAEAEKAASRQATTAVVADLANVSAAAKRASKDGVQGFKAMGAAGDQLADSLGRVTKAYLGLAAIKHVSAAVLSTMRAANDESQRQVDRLTETKNLIREITTITGAKEGPSDAEVERFIKVRVASGLNESEAKENILEYEGAGAAAKGKNISASEYERAKVLQARFAATAGGGPGAAGTYGKLAGLLLGLRKYDRAEDLVASETQFNRILSKGVGDNPTLIKQGAAVAGAFIKEEGGGIVKDERELAAITATASRINPEQAAEVMKSTTRVFRGFKEKWAPMLKGAKVTEHDTYSEAAEKVFAKIEAAEKAGRSGDAWLAEQGVDQHGRTHTMSMYRYRNFLKDTNVEEGVRGPDADTQARGVVPGRKMTGEEATAEIDRKFTADVSLRNRVAQAKLDAAQLRNAMPLQYAKEIELEALTRMENRGEGVDSAAAKLEQRRVGMLSFPELPGEQQAELGKRIQVEREMHRIALEHGLEAPGRPQDTSALGGYRYEYLNWIKNHQDTAAYSTVGSTIEMTNRTQPPKVAVPNNPTADYRPHPKIVKPKLPAAVAAPGAPPVPAPAPPAAEPKPLAMGPMGWRGALAASLMGATKETSGPTAPPYVRRPPLDLAGGFPGMAGTAIATARRSSAGLRGMFTDGMLGTDSTMGRIGARGSREAVEEGGCECAVLQKIYDLLQGVLRDRGAIAKPGGLGAAKPDRAEMLLKELLDRLPKTGSRPVPAPLAGPPPAPRR